MPRRRLLLAALLVTLVGTTAAQQTSRHDKLRLAQPDKEALRVVLRTRPYLQINPSGVGAGGQTRVQPRPFVEDLVALPALDSSLVINVLDDKDLDSLGLSSQQAYELGVANLRKALQPLMEVARVAGRGQIGRLAGDPFHPSRLLLLESWAPLAQAQGGALIVAAPTTDTLLYIGEDTPMAIDALRARVAAAQAGAPNRLSDTLLRWRAAGWEVVPKRGSGFKPS